MNITKKSAVKIIASILILTFSFSNSITYSSSNFSLGKTTSVPDQFHVATGKAVTVSAVRGELETFASANAVASARSELRGQNQLTIRQDARAGELARLWGKKAVNGQTLDVEETILWLAENMVGDVADALLNWKEMDRQFNALIAQGKAPEEAYAFLMQEFIAKRIDQNGNIVKATGGQIYEGGINNFLLAMGEKVSPSAHRWAANETVKPQARSKRRGLVITGPADKFDMLASQTNGARNGLSSSLQDFEDASPEQSGHDMWLQQLNLLRLYAGEFEGGKPFFHPTKKYVATDPEVKSGLKKVGDPKEYTMKVGLKDAPAPFQRMPGLHLSLPSVTVNGKRIPAFIAVMAVFLLNNYDNLVKNGFDVGFYIPKTRWPLDLFVWEKAITLMEQKIGVPQGTVKIKVMHEQAPFSLSQFINMWVVQIRILITNVGRWDQNASFIRMFSRIKSMLFPDQRFAGMLTLRMTYYTLRNAFFNVLIGVTPETAASIDPSKPVQLVEMTNALAEGGMAVQLKNNPKPDDSAEIAAEKLKFNANAISDIRIDKIRERLIGLFLFNKENGQKILLDSTRESWVATTDPEYVKAGAEPLRVELNANGSTLEEIVAPLQAYVDANVTPVMREKFIALGILGEGGKIKPTEFSAADLTKEKIDSPENWKRLMMPSKGDRTIEGLAQEIFFTFDYNGQQVAGNNAAAVENPLDGNGWLGILTANFTGNRIMSDHATNEGNLNGLYVTLYHGQPFTKDGKFVDLTGTYPDLEVKAGDVITPDLVYQLWLRLKVFTDKRLDNFEAKNFPVNRPVANLVMETVKRILIKTDKNGNPVDANGNIVPENGVGRVIQPADDIPYYSRILYTLNELFRSNRLGEANRVLTAIFTEDRDVLVREVERLARNKKSTKQAKELLAIYDYVHDVFDPSEAFGIQRSELRADRLTRDQYEVFKLRQLQYGWTSVPKGFGAGNASGGPRLTPHEWEVFKLRELQHGWTSVPEGFGSHSGVKQPRSELRNVSLDGSLAIADENRVAIADAVKLRASQAAKQVDVAGFAANVANSNNQVLKINQTAATTNSQTVEARVVLPKLTGELIDYAREVAAAQAGLPTVFIAETATHASAIHAIFGNQLPENVEIIDADESLSGLSALLRSREVTQIQFFGLGGVDRGVANEISAKIELPAQFIAVKSVQEFIGLLGIVERITTEVAAAVRTAVAA